MYFVLFCALSALTLSSAKQTYIDLPSDVVGLLTEKSVGCIAETGADINILQRVFQWQFDNDKTSKKFSFCLFKNVGLIDDTGKFDESQIISSLYRNSNKKEEIAKIAKECNSKDIKKPLNKMHEGIQCFFKNTPVLLQVKL
ncbi:PREDICTED: uncharacterized protein LOC106124144 [Papilio xuthus]|uniref:Uncharacterized protein LOC106124144 n=1 Tax=Papilio xuthus TaxID=66420 RepID=A0AAJ7EG24_PAPXU|nr:PREDICTED: uncharacterized protein LOC106124144 [Papilio xuthus]